MRATAATQRLETWLERLIDDEHLRDQFFHTPSDACIDAGLPLSWSEMGALLGLPQIYFDEFAKGLPSRSADWWHEELESPWPVRSH